MSKKQEHQFPENWKNISSEEAIKQAIFEAKPNTVILITGKGNETVQYVKGKYVPCETDVQYAKKYLKELDKSKK